MGDLESLLVDRIVAATWRLKRLARVETSIFAFELYGELAARVTREAVKYSRTEVTIDGRNFGSELGTVITDEQKHREAVKRAEEMESLRDAELATLGQTFHRDSSNANTFSKLSHYETGIERSIYKGLRELQCLQASRGAGGNIPPPVAVDVDVSGVLREGL